MKKSRALRRHLTKKVIKKRLKVIKSVSPDYKKVIEEPHRMAKKHPLDCGNPMCGLCHRDKITKEAKVKDVKKLQQIQDEIDVFNLLDVDYKKISDDYDFEKGFK